MTNLECTLLPELSTERLRLRMLEIDDAGQLFELRSDGRVNRFIDRTAPEDISQVEEWILNIRDNMVKSACHYWAITFKDKPQLIGTICLWNFSEDGATAETGYELHPAHWGHGFMHEALTPVLEFAFSTGIAIVEAYVNPLNNASAGLLLRNGFGLDSVRNEINRLDGTELETCIYRLDRPVN